MKVLLLTPPAQRLHNPATAQVDLLPPKTWVPLGIAYLTSALRENGVGTVYRDLHDDTWTGAASLMLRERPDVVGISCFTMGRTNAYRLAREAKRVLPGALVVMGGPHATFFPEHALANPAVDVVVLGEGEETIVELVSRFDEGGDFTDIPGLALRSGDRVIRTPPRRRTEDLDSLAFPAYDAFDLSLYKSPEIPEQYRSLIGTHVLSSRGCPFHCGFCSVNRFFEGRWARRSPGNVADELEHLIEDLHVRHLYFSDDLFTLDRQRVLRLCREIHRAQAALRVDGRDPRGPGGRGAAGLDVQGRVLPHLLRGGVRQFAGAQGGQQGVHRGPGPPGLRPDPRGGHGAVLFPHGRQPRRDHRNH